MLFCLFQPDLAFLFLFGLKDALLGKQHTFPFALRPFSSVAQQRQKPATQKTAGTREKRMTDFTMPPLHNCSYIA